MKRYMWGLFVSLMLIFTALTIVIAIPVVFSAVQPLRATCMAWLGPVSLCKLFPEGLDAQNNAQLSTSLFSTLVAALAALLASVLTGRQYERQERSRNEQRRVLTSLIVTSEIGAFAEQLSSVLHGAKVVPVTSENGKAIKRTVQINHTRLMAILPQQSTYEQLVSEIALLGHDAATSVARFYIQMRRVRADCVGQTMPLFPFAYMIQRTSEALLALERINRLTPTVIGTMNEIYRKIQDKDFQTQQFWLQDDPIKIFGWEYDGPTGSNIREWRTLAEQRPLIEKPLEED